MKFRRHHRIARLAALALLYVEGGLLFVGLPFLIFLGGWGGADSGGIVHGMLLVAGLPAVVFAVSAAGAFLLIRAGRTGLALCTAAIPALATVSIWILPQL